MLLQKVHLAAESTAENTQPSENILKACHLGLRDAGVFISTKGVNQPLFSLLSALEVHISQS